MEKKKKEARKQERRRQLFNVGVAYIVLFIFSVFPLTF
jgi:hypothetical protein